MGGPVPCMCENKSQTMSIKDRIPKKPQEEPWNYPGMLFCAGRYYYGIFMLSFAVMPGNNGRGGDVTGQLWRYENAPEEWVFTYRFRYYHGENNSAWDGQDRKKWFALRCNGPEVEVVKTVKEAVMQMGFLGVTLFKGLPQLPEWWVVEGDCDKAGDMLMNRPAEWMHSRKAKLNTRRD